MSDLVPAPESLSNSGLIVWILGLLVAALGYVWRDNRASNSEMKTRLATELQECKEGHRRSEELLRSQASELGEVRGQVEESIRARNETRKWHGQIMDIIANQNEGRANSS